MTNYIHHNSHQEVEGYMADALAIVDRLDIDPDLRGHAFLKAVDLLAAKAMVQQASPLLPPLVRR